MKIAHKKLLTESDMSDATISTEAILIDQIYGMSFQAVYTGSPVGSLIVELSNDITSEGESVTNWTECSDTEVSISAAGNSLINYDGVHAKWARVTYTKTSGTGSLSLTYFAKGA